MSRCGPSSLEIGKSFCFKNTGVEVSIATGDGKSATVFREIAASDAAQGTLRSSTIVGEACPNMPWEPRPAGDTSVVWRYSQNPVIRRDLFPTANSIFNSAVVPF